jgi:hypothetical protein
MGIKVIRVYTGDDGESHFEKLDINMQPGGTGMVSELFPATGVIFREVEGSYDLDFHTAPRRQYVVNLKGSVDIEVGDGTVERLGPGDILRAEDTTGRGHKSKAVNGEPRTCLFIPIDPV